MSNVLYFLQDSVNLAAETKWLLENSAVSKVQFLFNKSTVFYFKSTFAVFIIALKPGVIKHFDWWIVVGPSCNGGDSPHRGEMKYLEYVFKTPQ